LDLKAQIEVVEGTPVNQQRIIFSGHQLQDDRRLADYHIEGDSTLKLVLRLAGCACECTKEEDVEDKENI
jgi:hypothetical protein